MNKVITISKDIETVDLRKAKFAHIQNGDLTYCGKDCSLDLILSKTIVQAGIVGYVCEKCARSVGA